MIRIGDTFASLAPGHNYKTGLQYKRGDLFTIRGINESEGLYIVRHIDSGRDFKESQSRLESGFIKMPKTVYYTSDYAYIKGHLDQVDEMTLGAIKLLVEDSINPKTLEQRIEELEKTLIMQKQYFESKIGSMRYNAHKNGYHI